VPIQADYNLKVRALCEQVVISDIEQSKSLQALVGSFEKHNHPELAS
jgi:hypothetical protein